MVQDYTTKTGVLAERTREVESEARIQSDFRESVRTADGMAAYVADTLKRYPSVIGAAFEQAATGSRAKDFLVAIGEAAPEVFEEAYERLHEIVDDEDERRRYIKERDLQTKEANLQEREEMQKRRTFDKDFSALMSTAEKEAKRVGVEPDDLELVKNRLREKMRGQVRSDGSITLRPQDAKEVARDAKKEMDRLLEKALRQVNRKKSKDSREATKKKAIGAKGPKRSPPKGVRRKTPKERTKFKAEEGRDALDQFIDHRLST